MYRTRNARRALRLLRIGASPGKHSFGQKNGPQSESRREPQRKRVGELQGKSGNRNWNRAVK